MNHMKKTVILAALLVLIGASPAIAQTGTGSSMTKGSGTPQAPVGHRQPRAGDVPNEKNLGNANDPISKEDAILDKKIKSICRGC
jgi:hypothetical protein